MSTNRLYYQVKPYLPWGLRMLLRRLVARRQRKTCQDVWPINESAGQPPAGWPGWPEGKKFAFVLTHDVEGPAGLAKCRQLMQLEMELGYRSCFNFIPEGDYAVSRELRTELIQNGFEVGVHDLHHDGRLYQSHQAFSENAKWINHYLKEWGATGFRSGFMLRNLDWLHELNIQYDTSTFDTDPFEPQPEGADTIFPFWVQGPNSDKGYVELPYTLPQDFTQFIVLKEQGSDLWKQKLSWIIKKGGMALLDVHPDYLNFAGQDLQDSEYPVIWYKDLIEHIKLNHADECWFALPCEVAAWYRKVSISTGKQKSLNQIPAVPMLDSVASSASNGPFHGMRAAVVLYAQYESDARPRREAEALARAGMEVDVICLRENSSRAGFQKFKGINLFSLPLRQTRSGKLAYALQYSLFLSAAFFLLSAWRLRKRYDLVHVHSMPDILVLSALTPRLSGAKVILDLHDPMPELFSSIYNLPAEHRFTRILKKLEKWSIRFAHLVLTPNQAFKEVFVSRGCPEEKIQLLANAPDEEIFNPRQPDFARDTPSNDRPFVIIYHGTLVERHGLHLAIQAIAKLQTRIPRIQFHIYGEPNDYIREVLRLARESGLENVVQYQGFKPLDSMPRIISIADVGLIPNRLNPFTDLNLPTRIFECLAMNKPVIVPSTKGIRDYFKQDEILFFEPENVDDMAAKIEWVYSHPAEAKLFVERGRKVYEKYRWELEERRFLGLVGGLLQSKTDRRSPGLGRQPRKICMVVYSNYDTDNRVMRYAETLAARGDKVDVLAVKRDRLQLDAERIRGVNIIRLLTRPRKNQQDKLDYLLPILKYFGVSSLRLGGSHLKKHYDLVHVHNVPDFLVFAAWLPRLTGAKLILDIHDITPEFYNSKFKTGENAFGIKVLKSVERASARFAHHVIISNHLWVQNFISRSAPATKCSVFINHVNQEIFYRRTSVDNGDRRIILFPGGLQWHQGLDIAIRAMPAVLKRIPNAEFHIYGDGNMKEELVELTGQLGLTDTVRFFDPQPLSEIAGVMSQADLGVVPKRADSFGNEAYSTKIMEFMSLGVPMVVSSTKIDRFYFDDSIVRFFESGNHDALAEAIIEVLENDELRRRLIANALEYAEQNSWQCRQNDYLELVDALIENRPVDSGVNKSGPRQGPKKDRNGGKLDDAHKPELLAVK